MTSVRAFTLVGFVALIATGCASDPAAPTDEDALTAGSLRARTSDQGELVVDEPRVVKLPQIPGKAFAGLSFETPDHFQAIEVETNKAADITAFVTDDNFRPARRVRGKLSDNTFKIVFEPFVFDPGIQAHVLLAAAGNPADLELTVRLVFRDDDPFLEAARSVAGCHAKAGASMPLDFDEAGECRTFGSIWDGSMPFVEVDASIRRAISREAEQQAAVTFLSDSKRCSMNLRVLQTDEDAEAHVDAPGVTCR